MKTLSAPLLFELSDSILMYPKSIVRCFLLPENNEDESNGKETNDWIVSGDQLQMSRSAAFLSHRRIFSQPKM